MYVNNQRIFCLQLYQIQENQMLNAHNVPTALENSNPGVIMYLKQKCGLPEAEIERKLLEGETFDIKPEGNDLDTQLMEDVLRDNDFYEKLAQKKLKDQAIRYIKNIVEQWSVYIAKTQRKINKDDLPYYTAKILPFGSYVLDLKSNNSDIDFVCVVPHFIDRQIHFFQGLASKFQAEPEVKGLSKRKQAKVPIITFEYKDINIDISYCRLETETVPRDIERVVSMDLLNSIKDEQSKVSLLGRKNNLMILQLAGRQQAQNFKQTLRVVKVWAKNRGVSSNAMGFLGGISWAIMVAKICQIFPHHKPAKLLAEFFNIFKLWKWKDMAVQLLKPFEASMQNLPHQDKAMMTVITPGYYYNSTIRVNQITFESISTELTRASQTLAYKRADFQTLCQKSDFVNSFPLFIQIDICGKNFTPQDQKDYYDFQGSVQAKILTLLQKIIRYNKKDLDKNLLRIVPNPKLYKKNDSIYQLCSAILMGVNISTSVNIRKAVTEWSGIMDDEKKKKNNEQNLNIRIFQCKKEDFIGDVQVLEIVKKKEEREDPRLALLGWGKS